MPYYKTCPDCGAHLDPGERCDCKDDTKEDHINAGNENQD
nr:MAG TPA: RRN7 Zinc-finger of RNA-polymerase I-specific TFIIB, Rrn7 [Caudoviricetes sp.]